MSAINLHVVGCPRSGTTLMAEMLVACYPHQGHSEHEETIFKVAPHEQGLRLSKKPNDVLWMAPLLKRDPDLHVIVMLRDPRSVICSMHKAWPGMYFCNYPVWKRAEKAAGNIANYDRVLLLRYEDLVRDPMKVQKQIEARFPFYLAAMTLIGFMRWRHPVKMRRTHWEGFERLTCRGSPVGGSTFLA